ncbi:phosphoesterase RecJ domain-containing protein [Micromonospora pattaloongensis]|uniref:Phosphoesterase RecJ domain-containing protein n=1 Tax=Micromonospora pattaloongensis TaxID=405436 RepID=A0A1H3KIT5_9ACTN|nr:bifunctional oligoribonuclease/PAP phosphatase NrnA [Micromonospora pattaloongensis]SDY52101.1 phosphoesterase RecJ domain-containing protein [Micromonospora pattaloongensis]
MIDAPGASAVAEAPASPSPSGPTEAEWAAAVAALRDLSADARVLLICHVNPDGDALGSMLGFALGLHRLGVRRLQATFPGPPEVPLPFQGLPGLDLLVPADAAWTDPDLVLCFDAASASRLGPLADRLLTARSVVLDHHASNTRFGAIHLVDPMAAATSVVAEQLLDRLGVPLDRQIAECFYVAVATDTGSFRFDATTPAVHEMAARLIATGLRPGDIARRVFDSRPFGAVRLYGDVLQRAELEPGAAGGRGLVWTYATLDDLARHDQPAYVLEALIDSVRCAIEADVSCVLKQVAAGEWAVSLRSKGAVDVSRVAVALGGGGHRLAAGFTGYGSAAQVVEAIRAELTGGDVLTGGSTPADGGVFPEDQG